MGGLMGSRPPTVLNVFVSSPSDCSEERELVETLVADVNASPAALAANLQLKAIRWENLPPGETIGRDYQGRIDDLMTRGGLDRFEIYLGFMRERIGTPTRGHPSGTLSEFASARARRRTSGLPGEVLFYFLCDVESMTPAVAAIREEFEQHGFLYAVAPNRDVFRARLREHLLHIVATWWQWKNRLHRQLRNLRVGLAYVAAALLLGYVAFDMTTLYTINRGAAGQEPETAIQLWHDRSEYLPIVRWGGGRLVDASLRGVAASRLIESLIAQGFDPFRWKEQHLRPFEVEALVTFARGRLDSGAARTPGTDPAVRLAWAALAEDWHLVRQLATSAALAGAVHEPPEVRGFIEHAPADQVGAWLKQDLGPALPSHIAGMILEAVGRRAEPSVTFAALDSLRDGGLGQDAKEFDLLFTCNKEDATCAAPAAVMLKAWLTADGTPPKPALELLLEWANSHHWSRSEVLSLEPRLCSLLDDSKYSEVSPALIRFLAKWHSQVGAKHLTARLEEHVSGRISFGFQERVALIEALPMLGLPEADKTALAIARRSAADARSLARSDFAPGDAAVQGAYVRHLATNTGADWRLHRDWVRGTLERRLQNQFPDFHRQGVDEAFAGLLATASASRFTDLFEKPRTPIVDSFDADLSARRAYLLNLLPNTAIRLPEGIVADICRSIPAAESNRPAFYRALSIHGEANGIACLRTWLRQDARIAPYLADAGDTETLIRILHRAEESTPATLLSSEGRGEAPIDLPSLMEAAARLPPHGRAMFVDAAQRAKTPVDPAFLWPLASTPVVLDQKLIAAASAEIAAAKDATRIVAAMMYLQAVSRPADIWQAINSGADRFLRLMHRVDSFDWLRIAQALPSPPAEEGFSVLEASLKERRILLALDASQASPSVVLQDRLMGVRGKWFGNPLGRLLALTPSRQAAVTLRSARDATPTAVDVVGALTDSKGAYRAYMGWLLAEVLATLAKQDRSVVDRRAVSGWLADSDPVTARVMAGLTLAVVAKGTRAGSGSDDEEESSAHIKPAVSY